VADLVKPDRSGGLRRLRDDGPRTEVLVFAFTGELYAAPVEHVREILRPPPLTPVPRAPAGVLGVVSVRGRLVTVVDPRRTLGLAASPATTRARIVLVDATGGEIVGLYVDEVQRVERLATDDIEPAAARLGGDVAAHIAGIARPRRGRPSGPDGTVGTVVILDLTALFGALLEGP
jgi:purine-binding chemotaxis protein CheW